MKRITIHDIPLPGLADVGFEARLQQYQDAFTRPRSDAEIQVNHEENTGKPKVSAKVKPIVGWLRSMSVLFRRLGQA